MVVFSDGSYEAYGTAAYARWRIPDQPYESRLIAAKNRIAPIKTVDIVHLNFQAVLGKRLRSFVQEELRYSFKKVYHIVDSEIVKAMISKESYGFNTFAANCIGEIEQKTNPSEWFWVQGILNGSQEESPLLIWAVRAYGRRDQNFCVTQKKNGLLLVKPV